MKYRDVADYTDGRDSTISGREADDRYTPLGPLAAVGAEIVFAGEVDQQLLGDSPIWDRVGVVKYPTRRSFIEMQSLPDFQELHAHKDAGMAQTFVIGCQPIDVPTAPEGTPRVEWDDVPHPPTDDDGPVMVIHVLKYHDAAKASITPEDMAAYQRAAGEVAVPHGVRISGWFAVGGNDRRRRSQLGSGAIQPVPEQGGVHGGRDGPSPARSSEVQPGTGHCGHVHGDRATDDRSSGSVDGVNSDRYFAFLRAINTGNRRLTSDELLAPFHQLGFTDVGAYQAAGNVTFRSDGPDLVDERRIEEVLTDAYGFHAPTFVRSAAEVHAIAAAEPFAAADIAGTAGKVQVTFLRTTPSPGAVEQALSLVPPEDRVVVDGRHWYWLPTRGSAPQPSRSARSNRYSAR